MSSYYLSLSKWLASHLPFFNHIFKRHSCRKFIYTIESILHLWTNKRKSRTQSRSLCRTRTDLKIKKINGKLKCLYWKWIFQSNCRQFAAPKEMKCNPWNSIQISVNWCFVHLHLLSETWWKVNKLFYGLEWIILGIWSSTRTAKLKWEVRG